MALLRADPSFRDCDFEGGDFTDITAAELELVGCSLKKSDFSRLSCDSFRVVDSNLHEARFEDAEILEAEFLNSSCKSIVLRGARLNLSKLIDCDFSLSNVDGANLFAVDATGSRFRSVDFGDAKIDMMGIDRADVSMASLRFKDFKGRKLVKVNFSEADLSGSDFTNASFEECHLDGTVVSHETKFDSLVKTRFEEVPAIQHI